MTKANLIGRSLATFALLSNFMLAVVDMAEAINFDTNFVELDTSKMISTSEQNYAICNHHFPSNWRSVSVNGDELTIATKDKQAVMKKIQQLTADEKNILDAIKIKLSSVIKLGPFNVKSETGFCKLTTFDRNGGTSSMGSGGAGTSSSSSSSSSSSTTGGSGMSVSKNGKDSYIISKSDFPFNWQRVFINEDVVTVVYKDGRVVMLPQDIMRPDEREKMVALRKEVEKSGQAAEKIAGSFVGSFSKPMDFVNKALGGMFGR